MAEPSRFMRLDVNRQILLVLVILLARRRAFRAFHAVMAVAPPLERDAVLAQRIQRAHGCRLS
jgi:hypothetical protein